MNNLLVAEGSATLLFVDNWNGVENNAQLNLNLTQSNLNLTQLNFNLTQLNLN